MSSKPENYKESPPEDVDFSDEEWESMSYDMQYYHANKWRRDNIESRKREKRDWVNDMKSNQGCRVCEEDTACALDWHHVRGEKSFSIGSGANRNSIQSIGEEVEKCVLLCANCHRKIHHDELSMDVDDIDLGVDFNPKDLNSFPG